MSNAIRTTLFAAAGALALMSASAMAQTAPSTTGGATTSPPAAQRMPAANPLTMEDISKLRGTDVYGPDGKKVGDVSTVLMKPESKTIDRLVIAQGGILGVGSHAVAVPLDQFSWDAGKEGFRIAKTADELKAMPEWRDTASAAGATMGGTAAPPPSRSGDMPAGRDGGMSPPAGGRDSGDAPPTPSQAR